MIMPMLGLTGFVMCRSYPASGRQMLK